MKIFQVLLQIGVQGIPVLRISITTPRGIYSFMGHLNMQKCRKYSRNMQNIPYKIFPVK